MINWKAGVVNFYPRPGKRVDPLVAKVASLFVAFPKTQLVFRATFLLPYYHKCARPVRTFKLGSDGKLFPFWQISFKVWSKESYEKKKKNVTQTSDIFRDSYYLSITQTCIWWTPWKDESYEKSVIIAGGCAEGLLAKNVFALGMIVWLPINLILFIYVYLIFIIHLFPLSKTIHNIKSVTCTWMHI